jgi:hypothetical protein
MRLYTAVYGKMERLVGPLASKIITDSECERRPRPAARIAGPEDQPQDRIERLLGRAGGSATNEPPAATQDHARSSALLMLSEMR